MIAMCLRIAALVSCVVVHSAALAQSAKPLATDGVTALSISVDTNVAPTIAIEVKTMEVLEPKAAEIYHVTVGTHFGRDHENQPQVCAIRVKWGKSPEFLLNKSAYADLYSPETARITKISKDLLLLEIVGGDASHGYQARIEVAPYGAITRKVKNLKSGYEETTDYKYSARYIKASLSAVVSGIQ
jgi:hypothetical protein